MPSSRATWRASVEGGLVVDRARSRRSPTCRAPPERNPRRSPEFCAVLAGRPRAPAILPARPQPSSILGGAASAPAPTPVIVPPVPTPETITSTSPLVSFQISSAVVRRWISGLAGFSNCCGITAPGVESTISCALAIAAFMPCGPGVSTNSAPSSASILRRSIDIDLRHDQDQLVAARRGDERERNAGIAGGRLDQRRFAGRDLARGFHAHRSY